MSRQFLTSGVTEIAMCIPFRASLKTFHCHMSFKVSVYVKPDGVRWSFFNRPDHLPNECTKLLVSFTLMYGEPLAFFQANSSINQNLVKKYVLLARQKESISI